METADCFKCSLCVFLLEENEKLKAQLFDKSIGFSNCADVLSVDHDTQTDPISIQSVEIESSNVNSATGSMGQALLDIAKDIDKLYEEQPADDRVLIKDYSVQSDDQTNHGTPTVESVDKSCQISMESSNGSNCKGGGTHQKDVTPECTSTNQVKDPNSFHFDHNINTPFQSIPGKPFADFDVSKLAKDIAFDRINEREVKYFGDCSYSYGNSSHQPCPIPQDSYLYEIFERVKTLYPTLSFNSVLVTKFNDGKSFLPLHSDNETEIVENSHILTVSLGAGRTVSFQKINGSSTKGLQVSHGDVYVMSAKSQSVYRHGVPKDFSKKMRISLTFRLLKTDSNPGVELTASQISIANFLDNLTSSPEPSTVQESNQPVDTLFISSSMFRHLKATELRSSEHSSKVLFYPGATAGGILKRLKEDTSLQEIIPKDIKRIFLMCGSNDVDKILQLPRKLNDSVNINFSNFSAQKYEKTLVEMEHLTNYLLSVFQCAQLNVMNILPRASYVRNCIINDLNGFLSNLCSKQGYKFIDTELNRYLYSNRQGYRRSEFFNVSGSDNIHLNSGGIIKLGKLLKFLMHCKV